MAHGLKTSGIFNPFAVVKLLPIVSLLHFFSKNFKF